MERSDSTRIPDRVGLALFGTLGKLVAVRAPHDLDPIFRKAGGSWEPWSKRWLIERHRIGPVIRFSARPLTHCSDSRFGPRLRRGNGPIPIGSVRGRAKYAGMSNSVGTFDPWRSPILPR
jgi:hypothetical protein